MRKAIGLLLLLIVAGCASVPMADATLNAAGKRFEPPPPGQAQIYIYREGAFGGGVALNLSIGPRMLGALGADTWFVVNVDPGEYDIRCNAENVASVIVPIAAGETRYVKASILLGLIAPRCAVAEVTAEGARPAVIAGNRAAEIR